MKISEEEKQTANEEDAKEQLLHTIKQLNQVIEVLGKFTKSIQKQVEALPDSNSKPESIAPNTDKTETLH